MIISDLEQRAQALDPDRSFIVQAPAGSGKTELLIQRYLTLLARVTQPEGVVAITFTRKAAGEMRQRLVDALRRSAGPAPEQAHEALTWRLARSVRERSEALGWGLFANPGRLRVRTIDSLCAALTRQMPWLSRLGGPPNVLEDASDAYADAARRTVELLEREPWSEDVATLLAHLDNNVSVLQGLLQGMLARRDQWLRHLVGAVDPAQTRAALEDGLRRVVRDSVTRAQALIPEQLAGELAAVTADAGENLIAAGREGYAQACAGQTCLPDPNDLAAWLGIVDTLLTKEGSWRKKPNKNNGFPQEAKALKQRCIELIATLSANESLRAGLAALRQLPGLQFSDAQWQALQAIVKLLPVAAAQLQLRFRASGEADYPEVAMAAQRALGGAGEPTDLALVLDGRIQHLLVDEFQDTSVSQFALLEQLTAGWQRGDGRSIFLVGDPMQSIYRFREAEVGLFLKACDESLGDVPLELLRLSTNFRSDRGIVSWVNAVFPGVLPATEDITTGAIPFHPCAALHQEVLTPAVKVHPFLGRDDVGEAARVVELVRAAQARQAGKVAILARARGHLDHIISALQSAGLRFRAVQIDSLAATPLVQDLTTLTRALLHPADRIAWLALLRAPWCGLTLGDLHCLVAGEPDTAVWDLMADRARVERLSSDGRQRLDRVRSIFTIALASRPPALRAWVEGVWLALGGSACAATPTDLENAKPVFDLLEEMDESGTLDLARFQQRMQKLHASPDAAADESLQLMTIHKAKGLEFDVVIVPGLGRKVQGDAPPLLRWLERPRLGGQPDLLLAPVPATGGGPDNTYEYLKSIDALKSEHESGRLLYVAATRARSELHLLGHTGYRLEDNAPAIRAPARSSLLRRLWTAAEPVFHEAAQSLTLPPAGENAVAHERQAQLIQRFSSEWQLPAAPPAVCVRRQPAHPEDAGGIVSFHWVGDTLRHVGTVVHQMLRHIAEDGVSRWDAPRVAQQRPAYRSALAALGVPSAELPQAADRIAAALAQTLSDERGQWLLASDHEAAACEYPICGVVEDKLVSARIDRTFIDEQGRRWIVDYKSSSHAGAGLEAFLDNESERYREQLKRYCRLLTGLERRPTRGALYFPLLCAWRELDGLDDDHHALNLAHQPLLARGR